MRIARIELSGFKSFRERTSLALDDGITGVIGPNGCGKSNVVDAVRWALGEQRVRALRGDKMSDVIFAGSESARPGEEALVRLVFEAAPDELPAPHHRGGEVSVSRRLNRKGQSSYLINHEPARLRDIQSLFLGTGAGLSSYAIIEQGAVGMIVTGRPAERRDLIEEAAGISRYKHQRQVSERNLEGAAQNLARVSDLVHEINTQVRSLRQQASRAERYDALCAEERQLGLRAWICERRLLRDRAKQAHTQAGAVGAERAQLERDQASEREQLAIRRFELTRARERLEQCVELCLRVEGRQQLLSSSIEHLERELVQLQDTLTDNTQRIGQLDLRAQEAVKERMRLDAQVAELEDIRPQQQRVAALKADLEQRRDALRLASQRLAQLQHQRRQREQQLDRAGERLRALHDAHARLEQRRLRAAEEAAGIDEELAWANHELEEADEAFDDTQAQVAALAETHEALAAEHTRLDRARADAARRDQTTREQVIRLEAGLRTLEDVDRSTRAAQRARDRAAKNPLPPIASLPLAALLDVPRQHEPALAAALEGDLDALWLDPAADDPALIATLSRADAPRRLLALPPPDPAHDDATSAPLPFSITVLSPPKLDPPRAETLRRQLHAWLAARLAHVTLVDDDLVARWRADKRPAPGHLWVDPSGCSLDAAATLRRPGASGASSLLEQARQTRLLRDQLAEAHIAAADAAALLERALEAADAARHRLDAHNARLSEARDAARDAASAQREVRFRVEALTQRQDRCRRADDEIDDERQRLDLERERVSDQQATLREALTALQREVGEHEALHADAQRLVQEIEREVHQAQMSMARLEAQRQARLEALAQARRLESSLTEQIRRLHFEETSLFQRLEERREQRTHDSAELDRTRALLDAHSSDRAEAEAKVRALEVAQADVEARLGKLEATLRSVNSLHEAAEVEGSRAEATLAALDAQNQERYDCSPREARDALGDDRRLPFESAERARLDKVRRRLKTFGEVNTGAVRAYNEAREREVYLESQQQDLQRSVADLKAAIERIDRTCRARFKETFDAVNVSFQDIFPRLFAGGRAELVLTEPDDLLNSGVDIVAQPPGKRLQVLSLLSGGEKAMTAVALMAALFLLRPAPFCILDEVDAPLDDINVTRFTRLLRELAERSQLLVVTHNRLTMRAASQLYGVTMQQDGVSQLLSIRLDDHGARDDADAPQRQTA